MKPGANNFVGNVQPPGPSLREFLESQMAPWAEVGGTMRQPSGAFGPHKTQKMIERAGRKRRAASVGGAQSLP
jgi:hypothetical protein